MMSGFQLSDYAFVGDIHQVCHNISKTKKCTLILLMKLILIKGDVNMENNPYISVTGTATSFDADDHTFTMTPSQYIVLTHSSLPFPINAHFANWDSKKRWVLMDQR